jgi:raffinose/stachyose/melibiose transport system substrate-binding protein
MAAGRFFALFGGALAGLGLAVAGASAAHSDTVTINVMAVATQRPGMDAVVANFERVYPDIGINITYAPTTAIRDQLETAGVGVGAGPDVLSISPGCIKPVAVCGFAKAGHLAPMVNKPWVKHSLPLVTSLDKYGKGLYAFSPQLGVYGMFTNDALFKKLGLQIPGTFQELLAMCPKAKAAGTVAVMSSADTQETANLLTDLAVGTLYGKDRTWPAKQRAGEATFDGTPGWRQALQEYIDMYNAGCFEPGLTGTSQAQAQALFAQGQALMFPTLSYGKGNIDAASPQFTFTHHPFPVWAAQDQAVTLINIQAGFGVNSHSSAQNQAGAQTFLDFLARPKQNALFAEINGGLTQYEFLHQQIPAFMSADVPLVAQGRWVINPQETWWNPAVLLAMTSTQIGLITGQQSIDDVLNAMDAAWKQGPA